MTGAPYLSKHERAAVELVLRSAGFRPYDGDVWGDDRRTVQLREVFPSPFTVQQHAPHPCVGCDQVVSEPYPCRHCGFQHVDLGGAE